MFPHDVGSDTVPLRLRGLVGWLGLAPSMWSCMIWISRTLILATCPIVGGGAATGVGVHEGGRLLSDELDSSRGPGIRDPL